MPLSKNGKMYFTDEQFRTARYESSALEYARVQGYDLVKKGKYHTLREHDSMVFTERGTWFWNSRNLQGGALEFMTHYEHRDYVESVLILAGENVLDRQAAPYAPREKPAEQPADAFRMPERGGTHRRLFAYLTQTRGIDGEIVSGLLKQKKIYETKDYHSVAMALENNGGEPVGAFLRSTNTKQENAFRGMAKNSDRGTGYFCFGGGKDAEMACVFEAGIDAMSYASLQRMGGNGDLAARYYVASCGAGDANILAFLQGHPGVRSVMLCQDNDEAGHKMAVGLAEKLRGMGYNVSRSVPGGKDFNDDLLEARSRDADKAVAPDTSPARLGEPEQANDVNRATSMDEPSTAPEYGASGSFFQEWDDDFSLNL